MNTIKREGPGCRRYLEHAGHSVASFALPAAIVCHCMFHGASGPAALERDYVIHDIARTAVQIAGLRHELLPGLRAAGDPPVAVPRADCAIIRRMAVPASASAARFAEIGAEERCDDDRAGGEGRKRLTGLGHWAARSALIVSTMARNSRQASWQARMARSAAETKADS